jgi:hypothetical protein
MTIIKSIIYSFTICLLFFTENVLAIQNPLDLSTNYKDDKAFTIDSISIRNKDSYNLDREKGLKSCLIVSNQKHELDRATKELSPTDNYIVLYPKMNNKNNITITPNVGSVFDSLNFIEFLNLYKENVNQNQKNEENSLNYNIGVLEILENLQKEQEDKSRLEATVNLIYLLSFIISIILLKKDKIKNDRLIQSIISLILVASFILFIKGLPNLIYYII